MLAFPILFLITWYTTLNTIMLQTLYFDSLLSLFLSELPLNWRIKIAVIIWLEISSYSLFISYPKNSLLLFLV